MVWHVYLTKNLVVEQEIFKFPDIKVGWVGGVYQQRGAFWECLHPLSPPLKLSYHCSTHIVDLFPWCFCGIPYKLYNVVGSLPKKTQEMSYIALLLLKAVIWLSDKEKSHLYRKNYPGERTDSWVIRESIPFLKSLWRHEDSLLSFHGPVNMATTRVDWNGVVIYKGMCCV